jgi:hopanoid biosynthesis associated protein HpnK
MRHTLLIINGDDFGISEGINRGIVEAHRNGILSSATVMANMPAFDHAARLRREHPTLAVGVHLNLTAGAPLLPPSRIPGLVGRQGRFLRADRLMVGLTLGRIDLRQAEAELATQVERAIDAGFSPDHLDSHHHVHCHPALHPMVVRLARRYGIGAVRCPVELGLAFRGNAYFKAVGLSLLGLMLRHRVRRAGLVTSDHFRGVVLGMGFSAELLQRTLRRLPEGSIELMCHPGYPDADLSALTSYGAGRESELAALLDPRGRGLLQGMGVTLGTYSDLSGRR